MLDLVLRPAAQALAELHARSIAHRAIRLDNLFRANAAEPVTLGCAWAAPPASRQPAVYEPPYAAICTPAGRGDGAPADDIYALGVALIALALGQDPMAGLAPDEIIRRKLDLGSFEALTAQHRLPTTIADLVRGMVADDPEHRSSAQLLKDPAAARARRIAGRPPRRAQRSFPLGDPECETARELAFAIMRQPELAAPHLRSGAIGQWLRRGLGDGTMASRIDELCVPGESGSLADALLTTKAVAVLDPLAPIGWRGMILWPDGFAAALGRAQQTDPAQVETLTEIAVHDVALVVSTFRRERSDIFSLEAAARVIRASLGARQVDQGMLRLHYTINPLSPCGAPLLEGQWVVRLSDLLPALEAAASGKRRGALPPLDRSIIAFIVARKDETAPVDLSQLANNALSGDAMAQLRLLARLQSYAHPSKLPAFTAWITETVAAVPEKFHSQTLRTELTARLAELGGGGLLPPVLALLDDPARFAADQAAYAAAIRRGLQIDATLKALGTSDKPRQRQALARAREVTGGISMAVCGLALAAAAFL